VVTAAALKFYGRPALYLALLCWLALAARGASATAILDRLFIEEGETVNLQVIAEGVRQVPQPNLDGIPNLAGGRYLGPMQKSEIINGAQNFQIIHRYLLQPARQGDFVIPALSITTEAGTLRTAPVRCRVLPAEPKTNSLSLKIITERTNYFVGETVPYEIQLYANADLQQVAPPKMSLDGFVAGREAPAGNGSTYRDGQTFSVVTYRQTATPTKPGQLPLGPASQQFAVRIRRQGRGGFFDDFFGGSETRTGEVDAPARVLTIAETPAQGRPVGYAGAIGRFEIRAEISRTNLAVGDPITVRFTVTGQGSFDSLTPPGIASTAGLQTYPGTNSFAPADALGLIGTKTFEQAVVVESPDVREIAFQPFHAFDPESRRYLSVALPPIPLNVAGPVSGPGVAGGGPTNLAAVPVRVVMVEDLRPLKVAPGRTGRLVAALSAEPWFPFLAVAPLLAYALAGSVKRWTARRQERARPDRRELQRRSVANQVQDLARLETAGDASRFFAALNGALQAQAALVLGKPAASITGELAAEELAARGLAAESVERLKRVFAAADAARFASLALPEELAFWRKEATELIEAMRHLEVGR
jgi:hypothetical protein